MTRIKRKRSGGMDEQMVDAFLDWFINNETDPNRYKGFWDKHNVDLMAWWLEDKPLSRKYHSIEYSDKLEDRLFSRPLMWWCFEAQEPMKHYSRLFDGISYRPLDCMPEDEGLYLERHGLLTEREKQAKYTPPEWGEDYHIKEVSISWQPPDATRCSCWQCHLDELHWKDRLGFAYHDIHKFTEYHIGDQGTISQRGE